MLPSLIGIIASSGGGVATSYESIATAITTSGGYVDFNSIPQTYKHLQIRVTGASTYNPGGSGGLETWIGLNNTGTAPTAGYTHRLWGDGATAYATSSSQTNLLNTPWVPYGYADTYVGAYIIDILDYTDTNKNKTIRALGGWDGNGAGQITLHSGYSNITAAVTQIRVAQNAGGFKAGNHVALYGIKG